MAYPTSYTEQTLGEYIYAQLGDVADVLEWGNLIDIQPAIDEALAKCGVTDIAILTGADSLKKLRVLARYEGWALAVRNLVARFDVKDASKQQVFANAEKELARAALDAEVYLEDAAAKYGFTQYGQTHRLHDDHGHHGHHHGEW